MLELRHAEDLPFVGQYRGAVPVLLESLQELRNPRIQAVFPPNRGVIKTHVGVHDLSLVAGEEPGQVLKERTGILPPQVGGGGPGITQDVGGLIHQTQVDVPAVPQGQVPVEHHGFQMHAISFLQTNIRFLIPVFQDSTIPCSRTWEPLVWRPVWRIEK